ncbi:MAG: flagellar filament capping protein FliD [Thermoleophilaceae bacterium]|nr:flagellar filament capping protein FliD [Thermoleophilaceae bacterium]
MATSDPPLQLTGLASGIDTGAIVDQLMAIERRPRDLLALTESTWKARQSALSDIKSRLSILRGYARDLMSPGLYADVQSISSSDTSKVEAVRVSGAGTGGYQVMVDRLASSQQRTFQFVSSASDTTLVFNSNGTTSSVTIAAGADIQQAVDTINSTAGLPVYAAAVTDPADSSKKLLVLSSKSPGAAGDFTVDASSTAQVRELQSKAKAHAATGFERTLTYASPLTASATLDFGGGDTVTLAAGTDLATAVAQINAQSSTVYAEAFDGKLILTSRATGSPASFAVTSTSPEIVEIAAAARAGSDAVDVSILKAKYEVDGQTYYADSNTVTDGIPGIQLTLKATTATPVTITVGSPAADKDAIKAKIKAFVDQYNSTVDFIRQKLEEKKVSDRKTASDYAQGALFADPGLSDLLGRMRIAISDVIPGDPANPNPGTLDMLSQIGVSTGAAATDKYSADAVAGKLTLDEAKLDEALDSNPLGVRRLLGGVAGVDGFAQRFSGLLDPVVGVDGDLDSRIKAASDQIDDIEDQLAAMDERLNLRQQQLKAQFTALETALAQSQQQQAWLAGQIAGLMR